MGLYMQCAYEQKRRGQDVSFKKKEKEQRVFTRKALPSLQKRQAGARGVSPRPLSVQNVRQHQFLRKDSGETYGYFSSRA